MRSVEWDDAVATTNVVLAPMGVTLTGLHQTSDPIAAVEQAPVIVVCGGNTFSLLKHVRELGLLPVLRKRVMEGAPYIGWSAGANLTCPSIGTTNDMPIVDAGELGALGLLPFQINPHYTDAQAAGHYGETRRERIAEFCTVNPTIPVLGLPEGTSLRVTDETVELFGEGALLFRVAVEPTTLNPGQLGRFWSDL